MFGILCLLYTYNKIQDKKCIMNKLNGADIGASVLGVFHKKKKLLYCI